MKKILLLIVLAVTLVLTSCNKAPEIINEGDNYIMSFGAGADLITKAETTGFITGDEVGILACNSANNLGDGAFISNFIDNKKLTLTAGTPVTGVLEGDVKRWFVPTAPKISFVAYFPYSSTTPPVVGTGGDAGTISIPWAVNAARTNQTNLLLSVIKDADKGYRNGVAAGAAASGATSFTFFNALSKITFQCKLARSLPSGTTAAVRKITLKGVMPNGNLILNAALDGTSWTNSGTATDYVAYDNSIGFGITSTSVYADGGVNGGPLLMIPQTPLNMANISIDVLIAITVGGATTTRTQNVSLSGDAWVLNTKYNYRLSIGLSQPITFVLDIEDWGSGTISNLGSVVTTN